MKWLIKKAWSKRLRLNNYKVIKIKGWRTFLIDTKSGRRETITFLFGNYRKWNELINQA